VTSLSLTGGLFLGLVIVATIAAFVAVVVALPRFAGRQPTRIAARVGMLLGVNLLVLLTAATQLNAQFLFFADWTDLKGALGGTSTLTALSRGGSAASAASRTVAGSAATAQTLLPPLPPGGVSSSGVISYTVTGPLSGLVGTIMVQLPPGYTGVANAAVRYPVLETFQGYPGTPAQWIDTMQLGSVMADAVAANRMRSALIVSPQLEFPTGVDTECANGGPAHAQVETWLAQDVPNWVARTFRVQTARSSWASIGLSAGGWCAAMVAMLHPAQYSAAVVMSGYFTAEFGPLYDPFAAGSPLAARYNLVALAQRAPPPVALWVETSHADPVSYGSSAAMLKAARPPLAVTATVLQHAGHRMSLWQGLLPTAVDWLGKNITGFAPVP
jgi:enterochelin esterase-like enzyme